MVQVDRNVCLSAASVMEGAFRRLESQVPPPQKQSWQDGFFFRYREQTVEQALLQKLARYISGLHAIDVLLLNGFVQEQGVIQRTLDDLGEDIQFLGYALTIPELTPLHKEYLEAFWQEQFEPEGGGIKLIPRPMTQRKKIRAYINRVGGLPDPSTANSVGRLIQQAYSGYVHGASPQIMDMCGGNPPTFHLQGLADTSLMSAHARDAWNYYYRGYMCTIFVAKAFGDADLVDHLYKQIETFERVSNSAFFRAGGKATVL
jgi:hypothetical protein